MTCVLPTPTKKRIRWHPHFVSTALYVRTPNGSRETRHCAVTKWSPHSVVSCFYLIPIRHCVTESVQRSADSQAPFPDNGHPRSSGRSLPPQGSRPVTSTCSHHPLVLHETHHPASFGLTPSIAQCVEQDPQGNTAGCVTSSLRRAPPDPRSRPPSRRPPGLPPLLRPQSRGISLTDTARDLAAVSIGTGDYRPHPTSPKDTALIAVPPGLMPPSRLRALSMSFSRKSGEPPWKL